MAIQVVNLTDTFDQWRVKDNLTASNFGDLTALSTTDKSSLVSAINEINTNTIQNTMSGLANLDILQYNSSTAKWENKTMSSAGIPTSGFAVAMAIALG
jgi:hypothetical protein